ncbi:acyltransferase family protein [Methylobacterium tardum]|uniref:acyltransferase family protein n=2 Tax=Methylobacterium tardum TaxID=374432 RepID=UPI0024E109C1|nr:acyltransferase [Methylobacterium tardum]
MSATRGHAPSLDGIQIMRAAAATAVVFTHSITRVSMSINADSSGSYFKTCDGNQWVIGDFGVDLFFVISGFVMFYAHRSDFGVSGSTRSFMIKRLVRIVPLYWLLTSLAVFIITLAPDVFSNGRELDVLWYISSYLFIPFPSPSGVVAPVVGVGWTLNYEFMFYYLFGLSLRFQRATALKLITLVLAALTLVGRMRFGDSQLLDFYTSWLFCDFLGGVWVAWVIVNCRPLGPIPRRVLFSISVGIIMYTAFWPPSETDVSRFIFWGLPSILIVLVSCEYRAPLIGGLMARQIGAASYSIYLSQVFSLPFWAKIISLSFIKTLPFDCVVLILTSLVTISGFLVWIAIERPMTQFVRNKVLSSR